ncbi:MAG TPA: preprotein translocase subunit SecE [Candidatus Egerieimonas intestinavium]|uniref:Preprotein translocase subunit SecE n=1 Tax=Candidatus Egerieimonas intestinavium TaxID=2840777 RepID=A0A9D1JG18_9FIRM|nr:preprotein translocase subunit SecE [Candidatus Egerieimonas intestinavium]
MAGSVKAEKAHKKSWFKGLKSEFKKIVWPDRKTLGKQTVAVTVITAILCLVISVLDSLVLQILNFLIK